MVRNSPVLYSATEATQAHRNEKESYLTKGQVDSALEDSVEFPSQDTRIPTNRFAEEDLTVYAFGGEEQARQYGEFLRNAGINEMPVWVIDKDYFNEQSQPFTRQMWFGNLVNRSDLFGYDRLLHYSTGLRGVKSNSRNTFPKKLIKGVTDGELDKILSPKARQHARLQNSLEIAIMTQDFERAVQLRDEIKSLEERF